MRKTKKCYDMFTNTFVEPIDATPPVMTPENSFEVIFICVNGKVITFYGLYDC